MNGLTIDYLRFYSFSVCVCKCNQIRVRMHLYVGNLASQATVQNDWSKQIYLMCFQFDDNE